MYIEKIELDNFRNYNKEEIELNKEINIFYGNNAQGKTNIIESIVLLAYGKSFRAKKDVELINFNSNEANVLIDYFRKDRNNKLKVNISDKKTFFINDIKQKKVSDIIGKINVIIFTPDDIEIIKDGPDKRRRFLDMLISSLKPNYIYLLNNYNNIINERNNYIRQIKYEGKNEHLLDVFDEQLNEYNEKIFNYRKDYIEKIDSRINKFHNLITKSGKETVKIKYNTNYNKNFLERLKNSRENDIQKGYTTLGIHRDDMDVFIDGKKVSIYGSQGQQRTTVLSLKLTELDIVKEEIEDVPILLLDDFMSELDNIRRNNFLENIKDNQVILTCTDRIDLKRDSNIFYVENGTCKLEKK